MRSRILFLILLLASTTLLADDVLISSGGRCSMVVAAGSRIAASWLSDDSLLLHVARLNAHGTTLRMDVVPAPQMQHCPHGASDGQRFLFVWIEADDTGARLEGILLDEYAQPLPLTMSETVQVSYGGTARVPVVLPPVVVWDGEKFVAFWRDQTESAFAAEINTDGTITARYPLDGVASVSSATAGDGGVAVVWDQNTGQMLQIRFAQIRDRRVVLTGTIAEKPFNPGFGTPYYHSPSVTWNGENYYAAWISGRTGREEMLEATRVNRNGTPLDTVNGQGKIVASDYGGGSVKSSPVPFPYGTRFLLTWRSTRPVSAPLVGTWIREDGVIGARMTVPLLEPGPSLNVVGETDVAMLGDGRLAIVYTTGSNRMWLRVVNPITRRRAVGSL